jgi:flagellar hook protein FlgE
MSIFSSLTTGVSGLNAQSKAMGHISDNLANARTVGFKRVETSFSELVVGGGQNRHNPGAVVAKAANTHAQQGDLEQTGNGLNMAVSGDGFFTVAEEKNRIDGEPVFEEVNRYTRRGDFKLDSKGYLVNGGGYYLQGLPVDQQTGNPTTAIPQPLQLNNEFNPAQATTEVVYNANLPSNIGVSAVSGDDPTDFIGDGTNVNIVDAATVISNDPGNDLLASTFVDNTISGGAISMFDDLGAPVDVQVRWAKLNNGDPAAAGAGTVTPGDPNDITYAATAAGGPNDVWGAYYFDPAGGSADGGSWEFMTATEFDPTTGEQLTPTQVDFAEGDIEVGGNPAPAFTLNYASNAITAGDSGLTQFSDSNGAVSVSRIEQNGYPKGELAEVFVDEQGMISATFSNGNTLPLAKVPLVAFSAPDSLNRLDGGAFIETPESGAPLQNASGRVIGSAVENSNVDVADEFTKMIVAQRVYSGNAKVIRTSDEMLQEVMNIKR